MSDEPRRTFIGVLPAGYADTFVAGAVDPVAVMLRDADRRLEAEHAAEAKARLAQAADAERAKESARGMRTARAARRLGRALKALARLR